MGKVIYIKLADGGRSMTIFDVASYFLSRKDLTQKQIQKLCYYAQAWYYTLNEEALFDEHFEAWVHGPVNPKLYSKYKKYGAGIIDREEVARIITKNEYVNDFLQNIYEEYACFSGNELELLTHNEDPWRNARGTLQPWEPSYEEITLDSMKEYYSRLL